jgi:hypothetical protein
MQADKNKPAGNVTPGDRKDGKRVQADAQSDADSLGAGTGSPPDLQKAADDLKAKIAEAKRRNDLPMDSALGNPGWERSAADGHLDAPDEDDD